MVILDPAISTIQITHPKTFDPRSEGHSVAHLKVQCPSEECPLADV